MQKETATLTESTSIPPRERQPLISILLPCLNAQPFIEETLACIFSQTITDWELIVCDSHSDDGSWELLCRHESDPRVHLHKVPRHGLYPAWNECLRRAKGRFMHIATADDPLQSQLFERLLTMHEQAPECGVVYCDFDFVDEEGRIFDPGFKPLASRLLGECREHSHVRSQRAEIILNAVAAPSWITSNACLYKAELFEKSGRYASDLKSMGDCEMALRMALLTPFAFLAERLVGWRQHEKQATSQQHVPPAEEQRLRIMMTSRVIDAFGDEFASLFPDASMAKELLLEAQRAHYRRALMPCRHHPANVFARQFRNAWAIDRRQLFRHALAGFSQRGLGRLKTSARFAHLIDELQAEWPPRPITISA